MADGQEYIEIVVSPSNVPIAFKGQYHYRSGSTKQELKGVALQQFLLKKMGLSWDDMPVPYATIDNIDRSAIDYFLRRSVASERMDEEEQNASTEDVLRNLDLITPEGELKSAAILLFGKRVHKFFPAAEFKIGRFHNDESDLIIQDVWIATSFRWQVRLWIFCVPVASFLPSAMRECNALKNWRSRKRHYAS